MLELYWRRVFLIHCPTNFGSTILCSQNVKWYTYERVHCSAVISAGPLTQLFYCWAEHICFLPSFFKHLISFKFGVCVTGNQQSLCNKSHLWAYTSHWLNADLFLLMGFLQVLIITASEQFKSFNASILYPLSLSLGVNWISFNAT